jgi:hypothetical protein
VESWNWRIREKDFRKIPTKKIAEDGFLMDGKWRKLVFIFFSFQKREEGRVGEHC